ncbi:MAG TPA: spore coat protein U domain-containing protein, partial [Thermoanaerobaculia bacterium]|nr:spore coat protein U domain-containing protein [Thermoanaerobaculia bacterium]
YQKTSGGAWTNITPITMSVNIVVAAKCKVDAFSLAFGNYNPFVGALVRTSTVNVYCTKGTTATSITLDNGANWSGSTRRMISGANYLNYTASLSATSATATATQTPILNGITLTGTITAGQDPPVGSYIDTLQVTVNY